MNDTIRRLRERKLVQWALGYLAGAWLLLQVLTLIGQQFGWSPAALRTLTVLLGVGLLAVLVVAWFHGERGHQRVTVLEVVLLACVAAVGGIAASLVRADAATDGQVAPTARGPLAARQGSIAVLPFENRSPDPRNEYFSDGITEDVLTQLSRVTGLTVISRNSVMQYKETRKTDRQIGEELGVENLLRGSVQRDANRVRIHAQLVDARGDRNLWAERYDEELTDIFHIQSEIAERIATALLAQLSPEDRDRLGRPPTADMVAYDLYLRGRYLWNGRTRFEEAASFFEQAIARDPDYALAHAALADVYVVLPYFHGSPGEYFPRAREAALRALALDSTLAEAHASLAAATADYYWDWPAAERSFRRALELNPSYATAHQWYGEYLLKVGRWDEAIRALQRARMLDPKALMPHAIAGYAHYAARRYDEAIEMLEGALALDPDFAAPHLFLALAYSQVGRHAEAVAAAERADSLTERLSETMATVAWAHARAGNPARARELLAEMRTPPNVSRVRARDFALVHAGLNEHDRAFEWLDRAVDQRDVRIAYLQASPELDALRGDPRYERLLRRLGLH